MRKQLAALLLLSGALAFGQNSVEVDWNQVCQVTVGKPMRVKTTGGDTVEGYCASISVDEIAIRTENHKIVKVARAALQKMSMNPRQHQLRALGRGMRGGLSAGFAGLFTPLAPGAILLIPGTLAWGAISAPFCLTGDLIARAQGETEIRTR